MLTRPNPQQEKFMHKLNLPELPSHRPGFFDLEWRVEMELDGDIRVSLLRRISSAQPWSLVAYSEEPTPESAEDAAVRIMTNYRAVHG
jgi:hypothetical protein